LVWTLKKLVSAVSGFEKGSLDAKEPQRRNHIGTIHPHAEAALSLERSKILDAIAASIAHLPQLPPSVRWETAMNVSFGRDFAAARRSPSAPIAGGDAASSSEAIEQHKSDMADKLSKSRNMRNARRFGRRQLMAIRTAVKNAFKYIAALERDAESEIARLQRRVREELRKTKRAIAKKEQALAKSRKRKERSQSKSSRAGNASGAAKGSKRGSSKGAGGSKGGASQESRSSGFDQDDGMDDLVVPPDIDSEGEETAGSSSGKGGSQPKSTLSEAARAARRAARLRTLAVPRLPMVLDEEHLMLVSIGALPAEVDLLQQLKSNIEHVEQKKKKQKSDRERSRSAKPQPAKAGSTQESQPSLATAVASNSRNQGTGGSSASGSSNSTSSVSGSKATSKKSSSEQSEKNSERKRRSPPTLWELLTPMQARDLLPRADAFPCTRELLPSVPESHRGQLLSAWVQLCRISPLLRLSPIGLEALAESLLAPDSESALLGEIFSRGTRAMLGLPLDKGQALRAAATQQSNAYDTHRQNAKEILNACREAARNKHLGLRTFGCVAPSLLASQPGAPLYGVLRVSSNDVTHDSAVHSVFAQEDTCDAYETIAMMQAHKAARAAGGSPSSASDAGNAQDGSPLKAGLSSSTASSLDHEMNQSNPYPILAAEAGRDAIVQVELEGLAVPSGAGCDSCKDGDSSMWTKWLRASRVNYASSKLQSAPSAIANPMQWKGSKSIIAAVNSQGGARAIRNLREGDDALLGVHVNPATGGVESDVGLCSAEESATHGVVVPDCGTW